MHVYIRILWAVFSRRPFRRISNNVSHTGGIGIKCCAIWKCKISRRSSSSESPNFNIILCTVFSGTHSKHLLLASGMVRRQQQFPALFVKRCATKRDERSQLRRRDERISESEESLFNSEGARAWDHLHTLVLWPVCLCVRFNANTEFNLDQADCLSARWLCFGVFFAALNINTYTLDSILLLLQQ